MAHMLGGKYCLESLGRDVGDLQSAVADALSRVGPVRYPSWKFPDKVSSDINIEELLEDYKFSEDEEENQVAHVMLFELVIDRMVLLLQSFTCFVEQLIQGSVGRPPTATPMGTQMSIGLVVKKFWNKIVQLNSITQKLSAESKSKGRTISKLEVINVELQEQLRKTMQSTSMSSHLLDGHVAFAQDGDSDDQGIMTSEVPTPSKSHMTLVTPQPSAQQVIAIDTRTTSSQTLETAFVPCETCERVQLCLKDVGETITEVCHSQKLPSSIARHRKQLPGDVMSAMDVSRWTTEQNKDLERIKDHLRNLMAQIEPLEAKLAASQEACERLTENVSQKDKDFRSAKVSHGTEIKQFEAKVKEIERQHAESIMVVKRSYEEARSGKKKTEEELTKLKRELQRQFEALKELEGVREELNQSLDANISNQASVNRLESHVTQLSQQLKETQEQLTESSKQLGKEQAKNRSIDKHGQALQSKHDALVQRVEELDQECQDLREGLADAEDGKEDALEQLKDTQSELQGLQDELKTQQDLVATIMEEKKFMESSVSDLQTMILALEEQLKDSEEREKMLILYPDNNPGVVPAPQRADGDSASGMGQQVQTNNLRIQILEEQNNLLRNNIDKLLAGQGPQGQSGQVNGPNIPLWQADTLKQAKQSVSINNNHTNARLGKSPRSPRGHLEPIHIPNGHHPLQEHLTEEEVIAKYTKQRTKNRQYSPSSEEATSYQIPPRPPSRKANRDKSKPKSGGKRTSSQSGVNVAKLSATCTTNPSLHAYRTLKGSGAIKTQSTVRNTDGPDFFVGNRTPVKSRHAMQQSWKTHDPPARSEGTQSRNSYYEPQDTFICQQCDKMYDNKRNLDIHKSYCYP